MPLDHVALRFGGNADAEQTAVDYGGVRYRSRLHAQWAAFFDALGLDHVCDPRSFSLGGATFVPDFWLPQLNAWLTVNPADFADRNPDRWKVELFARMYPDVRVWLAKGAPRPHEWHLEQLGKTPIARGMLLVDASEPRQRVWVCGATDETATRLAFDAIEIGTGKSTARPRTFPADPNADGVMRMAYGDVEHFSGDTWRPIGMADWRAGGSHSMTASHSSL